MIRMQKVLSGAAMGLVLTAGVADAQLGARSGAWTRNAPDGEWQMTGRDFGLSASARWSRSPRRTWPAEGGLVVLDRHAAWPRGQPPRRRQRDVRAHLLPEQGLRARSVQGRRAADLEVHAEAVAGRDPDRLLRPGEPRHRVSPERQDLHQRCSRATCSRSMRRPARNCGRPSTRKSRTPASRRSGYKQGATMTDAPIVIKDIVIAGISGGEFGVRGRVSAFDANTGKQSGRRTAPARTTRSS